MYGNFDRHTYGTDDPEKVLDMIEGLADTHQKMVSLEDVCKWIKNNVDDDILVKCGSLIKCMDVNDFILYFCKTMEK